MATKIKNNQTILFIGDSITDCGRRAAEKPLGCGYVKLFTDFLTVREPTKKITVINKGIGGDRVTGLQARWSDDVMFFKPDWLSIKIGINDLHSVLRQDPNLQVTVELFEDAYNDILDRTVKKLKTCKILLITPFYISTERSKNSIRREILDMLPGYIDVVYKMSKKYKTKIIDTHKIFQTLLKTHPVDTFCNEPVHPNMTGHLAIAAAVYNVLSR